MAIPPLVLKIVADSSGVKKGVAEANAGVSGFKSSVTQNAALIKTALAGAVVAGFAVAIKAAADLGESQNKANVIFGESVKSVNAFASSAAEGFGLAKAEALEGAASFGAMFDSARLAEDESAKMSVTMSQLAGDMASFNNQDPSEMLERLRSGLAGEAEPLRRFGVFISEARVQTEAYRLGLAQVGEELTDAQKIQARYSIILKDTTKQQGDFARTLGESLPNQLRVLRAEFINIAASIGQVLLPAALEVVKVFRALLGFLADNKQVVAALLAAFLAYKALTFLPPLLLSIAGGLEAIGAAGASTAILGLAARLSAIGVSATAAGVGALYLATSVETANQSVSKLRPIDSYTAAQIKAQLATVKVGDSIVGVNQELGRLQDAYQAAARPVVELKENVHDMGTAADATAEEIRNLRNETLQLAGGFLGLIGAADQVQAAQKEVNELQRKGKTGTEEYRDAVLAGLQAQFSLTEGMKDYAAKLHETGVPQRDVIGQVKDLAREFGLEDEAVRDLIASVREHISGLNKIPSDVQTTVTTTFQIEGTRTVARQHGGPVSAFRPYIVGERGPELFVPSTSGRIVANGSGAGGVGGGGGDIVLQIDGREFARITRDELHRLGRRNVTAGIP